LDEALRLAKTCRLPRDSYFLRAESFFNVASEIERLDREPGGPPIIGAYGGHSQDALYQDRRKLSIAVKNQETRESEELDRRHASEVVKDNACLADVFKVAESIQDDLCKAEALRAISSLQRNVDSKAADATVHRSANLAKDARWVMGEKERGWLIVVIAALGSGLLWFLSLLFKPLVES
jgi:hypothetical protein